MGKARIGGVLRAQGVLGASAQRVVRMHCERGNTQEMVEAVADAMLGQGIGDGTIPANAGMQTRDLLDRAEAAMYTAVRHYHEAGGVLVAKGFVSIQGLVAEMAKQWLQSFSPPIPTETVIPGTLRDPEILSRLTVVALALRDHLIDTGETVVTGPHRSLVLDADDLEAVCQRAAVRMFVALQEPNTTNHEIIHKEKPDV